MKRLWLFLLLLSVLGGAAQSEGQAAKTSPQLPQLAVAISTTDKLVKAGSSIVIEVGLTNASAQTVGLPTEMGRDESQWYTVDVHRQDGSMASALRPRPAGHPLPPGAVKVDVYSTIMVELKPGETRKERVVISDLYDLTQPGKYSIQARCGLAKSNTITVIVAH